MWPTPDTMPEAPNKGSNKKSNPPSLLGAAELWQTPSVAASVGGNVSRGQDRAGELLLRGQAKAWATPIKSEATGPGKHGTGSDSLRTQVHGWGTPAGGDWKDTGVTDKVPTNGLLSRQVLRTETDGSAGSPSGRVLNPLFVEMLMGWLPGVTDYGFSETVSSRWRQRMRTSLCVLGWEL
jgi:hypothetical protein